MGTLFFGPFHGYFQDIPFRLQKTSILYISEDHAIGLSTFTIMAGLGGSLGYAMGGLDWGYLGK